MSNNHPLPVVILAGGMGTRLAEHTEVLPKPMVEIGGRPILWHIMKHYAHHGHHEFYVALGYKGDVIKRYFRDYYQLSANMTVTLSDGRVELQKPPSGPREDWTIHLVDTGLEVMTGGRVKRLEAQLRGGPFLLTYGDGVSDVDVNEAIAFHKKAKRLGTVTAVRPPARFGGLALDGDLVKDFTEKPQIGEGWINGGFMVLEPQVLDYIKGGDGTVLERDVLEVLAAEGKLAAYRHERFWQCMDTLRDVRVLEALWQGGRPPWRTWG